MPQRQPSACRRSFRQVREDARTPAQNKKRNLLPQPNSVPKRGACNVKRRRAACRVHPPQCCYEDAWRVAAFRILQSPQRPVIQQQHHKRPGHQHGLAHQTAGQEEQRQAIVESQGPRVESRPRQYWPWTLGPLTLRPLLRVADVEQQREKTEESAQDILPFGHPGDRLHPQRMQGKQRGHRHTPPQRPRQQPEQQEDQHGVGGVQHHIGKVKPTGCPTKEARVQHQRKPGQRVPVISLIQLNS